MNPYLLLPGLGLLSALWIGAVCVTYPGKPQPVVVAAIAPPVDVQVARLQAFQSIATAQHGLVLARLRELGHPMAELPSVAPSEACSAARVRAGGMTGQEASWWALRCPEGGDEGG